MENLETREFVFSFSKAKYIIFPGYFQVYIIFKQFKDTSFC